MSKLYMFMSLDQIQTESPHPGALQVSPESVGFYDVESITISVPVFFSGGLAWPRG